MSLNTVFCPICKKEYTNEEVINRIKQQENQIFKCLHHILYEDSIKTLTNLGNEEEAKEIWQEVMEKLLTKGLKNSHEEIKNLKAYIFRMVINKWKKTIGKKKNKNISFVSIEDVGDIIDSKHGNTTDEDNEYKIIIGERCIKQLAPDCQKIILLKDVEELSHEEIAGRLKITIENSRQRIIRCRKKLHELRNADSDYQKLFN